MQDVLGNRICVARTAERRDPLLSEFAVPAERFSAADGAV
jgi:hypothetical protein